MATTPEELTSPQPVPQLADREPPEEHEDLSGTVSARIMEFVRTESVADWIDPLLSRVELGSIHDILADNIDAATLLSIVADPTLDNTKVPGLILALGAAEDTSDGSAVASYLTETAANRDLTTEERLAAIHALRLLDRGDLISNLFDEQATLDPVNSECVHLALRSLPNGSGDVAPDRLALPPDSRSPQAVSAWMGRVRAGGVAEAYEALEAVKRGEGVASAALGFVDSVELKPVLLELLPSGDASPYQKSLGGPVVSALMRLGDQPDLDQLAAKAGDNQVLRRALLQAAAEPQDLGQAGGVLHLLSSKATQTDPELVEAARAGWNKLAGWNAWLLASPTQRQRHLTVVRQTLVEASPDSLIFQLALEQLEEHGQPNDLGLLDRSRAARH